VKADITNNPLREARAAFTSVGVKVRHVDDWLRLERLIDSQGLDATIPEIRAVLGGATAGMCERRAQQQKREHGMAA
jgi:hypothetical protein